MRSSGKKVDTIMKHLREALERCRQCAPSVLLLDNADVLLSTTAAGAQDAAPAAKLSLDKLAHGTAIL